MIFDILVTVLVILAAVRGLRRGLIVGLFSFIAIFIGLAAAIKLSTVVAAYLEESVSISRTWLPIIAFAVVFIVVILLVRLGANLIQRTVELAMLGWINRVGGLLLFVAMYITVLSVLLFYLEQAGIIRPAFTESSVTYPYVKPWGPRAIELFGSLIPWFKGMFAQLQQFFEGVSEKASANPN